MFSYAASYFGNADAQYDLARLYLKTPDASRDDFRYGARWLGLAAQKGQHQAQALLGQMLFNGDRLPPQRARGLMWLTLGARQRHGGRDLDQGKLQPGDRQSVRRRPRHGAADARALGAGPPGLSPPLQTSTVPGLGCRGCPGRSRDVSRSIAQTGTWSDGFSQART